MTSASDSKWMVLFTACLLTVMLNFDATAVNIAVPVMAHDLKANLAAMQWVINAFVLVSAMFQIIGGRLGDIHGPRRIYMLGTVIFILASLFAGMATSEQMLILGRVGQGFALGIAYPMTLVLIMNAFPEEEQATAMGFVMGTMGVSLAIGPTLGGIILHYLDWRWIFLINLPIGILTVICTLIYCSADKLPEHRPKLDHLGGVFLIAGLFGIILSLNQSQEWGLDSIKFASVMAAGLVSILILYFIERNRPNRLIDFNLFKRRSFALNSLVRIGAQMVFLPVLFFVPIYLQNILGFGAVDAGLSMLACTFILGFLSPMAGKIVDRTGDVMPTLISMITYAIGCFLFYRLDTNTNLWLLFSGLLIVGFATGINFVSTTAGALKGIEQEKAGMASGVFFTIVWGSCALGIAVFGYMVAACSREYLVEHINKLPFSVSAENLEVLARVSKGLSPNSYLAEHFSQQQLPALTELTHSAFMAGFGHGFAMLTVVSIIGAVLNLQ